MKSRITRKKVLIIVLGVLAAGVLGFVLYVQIFLGGYITVDKTKVREATYQDEVQFIKYAALVRDGAAAFVEENCSITEDWTAPNGVRTVVYQTEGTEDLFPGCREVRSISRTGDVMNLEYIAEDGREVTLGYLEDGRRVQFVVYDEANDALYADLYGKKEFTLNFRHGQYEISLGEWIRRLFFAG